MNQARYSGPSVSRGFTLVETLIVVVLLAIAAVGVGAMQGRIFSNQSAIKDLQVGARLMQECAEQVLAVRRHTPDGYAALETGFGANSCGGVNALAGFSVPTVTFTDPYAGAGCPVNGICKLATITQNGITPVTLLLVDY